MKTRQTWRWVDAKGQQDSLKLLLTSQANKTTSKARDRQGATLHMSQRLGSIEFVFLLSIAHISGYSLIYHSNLWESLGARFCLLSIQIVLCICLTAHKSPPTIELYS